MKIQLFICQKCGEEFDSGDLDRGRHAYCGGQGDPNGEIDTDEDSTATDGEKGEA